MNVELGNLKLGEWRNLSETEMAEINAAVATSTKTALKNEVNNHETDTLKPASVKRIINKKVSPSTLSLKIKKQ